MAHILIVDDSATIRAILKFNLEGVGHRVTEAENGEDAIQLAQSEKPDLILLDAILPNLNGWAVCQQLKKLLTTKAIPTLMLTSQTEQMQELRGWEAGANEYIPKSDDLTPLLNTVEKWLSDKPRPS